MCKLEMHMQCYDRFFEVLPTEVESAEIAVEEGVGQVLLDLFGGGMVDDVTVDFSSNLRMGLRYCSISISAQCLCQGFVLFPDTKEHMKLEVEKSIRCLLKELFGSVHMGSVRLIPSSCDEDSQSGFFNGKQRYYH
ncbi:MAG TPA: hypothetical protein VFA41_14060 [Ktedonobacteraceae bacterium]|jgi:hypothetical protein|nr:hypothetical protein [Ktedonobacteraceae bacterium]